MEPLLEMDKDEKKFEIFLSMHKSSLHVSELKVFLPFTINLDPFIRKVSNNLVLRIQRITKYSFVVFIL